MTLNLCLIKNYGFVIGNLRMHRFLTVIWFMLFFGLARNWPRMQSSNLSAKEGTLIHTEARDKRKTKSCWCEPRISLGPEQGHYHIIFMGRILLKDSLLRYANDVRLVLNSRQKYGPIKAHIRAVGRRFGLRGIMDAPNAFDVFYWRPRLTRIFSGN